MMRITNNSMDSKEQELKKIVELLCESSEGKDFLELLRDGQKDSSDLKAFLQKNYPSASTSLSTNISEVEVDKIINIATAGIVVIRDSKPNHLFTFLFLAISLISIAGFIIWTSRQPNHKFLSFVSPKDSTCKFSGEYPEDWTYKVTNNPISYEILVFIPSRINQDESEVKFIVQCNKPKNILSVSEYINEAITKITRQKNFSVSSPIEVKETTFSNRDARQLTYTAKVSDTNLKFLEVMTLHKGIVYQVTYRVNTLEYKKHEEAVKQMIRSFKIIEP